MEESLLVARVINHIVISPSLSIGLRERAAKKNPH